MKAQLSVGIIGAGPGGIASGILLTRAGHDFTIFDREDGVGERSNRIFRISGRVVAGRRAANPPQPSKADRWKPCPPSMGDSKPTAGGP
jgi:predicted NAD/FAD-dependent oxidoreductase